MVDIRWKADAREYGRILRKGGWWLAYLAARNVTEGTGNGVNKTGPNAPKGGTTVPAMAVCSIRQFAEEAGTTHPRVSRHLEAWDRAADAGIVPQRAAFVGTNHNVPMPDDDEDPFTGWYDASASVATSIKGDRRADIIAAANADGVGASKTLDVAQNRKAVLAAIKGDPELAKAIAEDSKAAVVVADAIHKKHEEDRGPRVKPTPEPEPEWTISEGLYGLMRAVENLIGHTMIANPDGFGESGPSHATQVDRDIASLSAFSDWLKDPSIPFHDPSAEHFDIADGELFVHDIVGFER